MTSSNPRRTRSAAAPAYASLDEALKHGPNTLLEPRQLAPILHVHSETLSRWRAAGLGPKWLKIEHGIAYRAGDVLAYLESRVAA